MALTAELGKFLQDIRFKKLPGEAVAMAQDAFADTVGVIMAGIDEPIVGIVHDELSEWGSARGVRACLSKLRTSSSGAALLNGVAAHALDYDDQALTGHPSAVLVPAILAEGEALGSSGEDMVTAWVAGYEVWAELVGRSRNYHAEGWHPTSVFGVVAAAGACAVLRGLDASRASTALAIAASHAGGLAANFGTMTKPYHAGVAARDGVISARLAAAGATASETALEEPNGYLFAFSPRGEVDLHSPARVGSEWQILSHGVCVKRYPTCYFMHRSFDSTVSLLAGRGVKPEDIADVEVTMSRGQATVLANERPRTGLEAKFSEQFAMAAAVVLGRMGLREVTDEVVQREDIQSFFPKVRIVTVDEYDPRDPAHSPSDRVKITLVDGSVLDTGPISSVRGHAMDPLSVEELWQKFRECTAETHDESSARELFDKLRALAKLNSVAELPTCESLFADRRPQLQRLA